MLFMMSWSFDLAQAQQTTRYQYRTQEEHEQHHDFFENTRFPILSRTQHTTWAVLTVLSRMGKQAKDPMKPPKGTLVKDCTGWLFHRFDSVWQCLLLNPGPIVSHLLYLHLVVAGSMDNSRVGAVHNSSKNPSTGLFRHFSLLNFYGCFSAYRKLQGLGHFNLG